MAALDRKETDATLIGDCSRAHTLPLVRDSKHPDLSAISASTLASLLQGQFPNTSYRIIDCRYPYEFEGGHLPGAENLYKNEQVLSLLNQSAPNSKSIIIFHCEFSSERGPRMLRYLRQEDRSANEYPQLTYPEVYLLSGGYKQFFESFPSLCQPQCYVPMLHCDHESDLRHFRAKSKSYGGRGLKSLSRRGLGDGNTPRRGLAF